MSPDNDRVFHLRWQVLLMLAAMTLVLIFTQGTAISAAQKGLLDINSATQAELEAVKGIGPVTAKKIIDNRPYKSLTELEKAGLSPKEIGKLKTSLTAKPAPKPASPAAAPEAQKTGKSVKEKKAAPKPAPGERVNLNTASQEDLEKLPGIGPTKAKAIIKGRPYKSPEDIMKVRGIKEGTYKKLKDFIIVK